MSKSFIVGAIILLESSVISDAAAECRILGRGFFVDQNDKVTYEATMDSNGCRHVYGVSGSFMIQKTVVMQQPANGTLSQIGEFSFFYKPKPGFSGKDSYVIYVCGTDRRGTGCSRLTYHATVR